jgi:hypothetical protein
MDCSARDRTAGGGEDWSAMELSSAVYTHTQLLKAGVDARIAVWEGLFHGFFYNPDVPESKDCYDIIVKYFDRQLGK